jgi:heme oxygenase
MNTDDITKERLFGWRKKLAQNNATPVALLAVGHGPNNGQTVVCIPEHGLPEAEIGRMLIMVGNQLLGITTTTTANETRNLRHEPHRPAL